MFIYRERRHVYESPYSIRQLKGASESPRSVPELTFIHSLTPLREVEFELDSVVFAPVTCVAGFWGPRPVPAVTVVVVVVWTVRTRVWPTRGLSLVGDVNPALRVEGPV